MSDLGSEQQFDAFQSDLRKHGLDLLLDVVPNHMAASAENPWWMDLLENGPASVYSAYFDADRHPPSRILDSKILLPVLGSVYAEAFKNQELQVLFDRGSFFVKHHDGLFPVAPRSYLMILTHRQHVLEENLRPDSAAFQEYSGIIAALSALPVRESVPMDAAGERRLLAVPAINICIMMACGTG